MEGRTSYICGRHLSMVVVVIAAVGCAPTPVVPPNIAARSVAREEVDAAHERARAEADAREPFELRARYNPSRCDGPPFEIYAHGRWQRSYLEATTEAAEERLEVWRRSAAPSVVESARTVVGSYRGRRRSSERGVRYPVFRAEQIGAPVGSP